MTDKAVLTELGARLAKTRLSRDLTQRQLGQQAGVSRTAIQRIEAGEPATMVNFVRILRVLGLLDGLDALVPAPGPSPIAELERERRQRRRASGLGRPSRNVRRFKWGDE